MAKNKTLNSKKKLVEFMQWRIQIFRYVWDSLIHTLRYEGCLKDGLGE